MMSWVYVKDQKKHTQDGCQLAALMKKAPPRRPIKAIDLGCGDGIITSEMFRLNRVSFAVALDISKEAIKAAEKNLEPLIHQKKVETVRQSAALFFKNKKYWDYFDRVVINPPYFVLGSGPRNKADLDHLARHEGSLHLKAWAKGSYRLLKQGGELYCVFPTERLSECFCALSQSRMEPKEIWWLKSDKRKRRFFLRATKGAKPGLIPHFETIIPPSLASTANHSFPAAPPS